jgi:TonB family protein
MLLTTVPTMTLIMSYQALLFCPDEKTARNVTQVLSELDFSVTPSTEPFAAVKKLMGERFDAIVVDCDNEQNATLLFKSARSAPNNQGTLAVAVVEGQAGVAKAFRIGANLVLTKPINVEQAKGTLRVARGLLRKNEGAKTSTSAATPASTPAPPKPAASPTSTKPPVKPTIAAAPEPPAPVAPAPAIVEPVIPQQPVQPVFAASPSVEIAEAGPRSSAESAIEAEIVKKSPAAHAAILNFPQSSASKITAAPATPEHMASSGFAASAPAPAREQPKDAPTNIQELGTTAPRETKSLKTDSSEEASVSTTTPASVPAPSFTFGSADAAQTKTTGGGSKSKIIIAVAIVLIAAAGYAAWVKFAPAKSAAPLPVPVHNVPRTATSPAPVTNTATSNSASAAPSVPASPTEEAPATAGENSEVPAPTATKAAKSMTHAAKTNATPTDAVVTSTTVAENKPATPEPDSQPIVIKNDHVKPTPAPEEPAEAPAVSMDGIAPANGALPNFAGPANAPTPVLQKLVISQGVSRGLLIKQVQPIYPRTALDLRIEGAVQIMATVSKSGDISEAKVLSGDKQLAQAAINAVKQWKYKPYLLNGEPVEIQTQITVNFKLPN